MGILSRLKKLFEKKEEEESPKEEKEEQARESYSEFSTPVEEIRVEDTYSAIKSWEKTLEAAKQHPLSQVKILNTQILEELTNVLKQMDAKLSKLDKLDEILAILHETKKELSEKGVESTAIDRAIEEIEKLTIKDKEVVAWIAKQGRVTAKQLADYTGLSRSTASFRLNRLAELGILEKEAIGKKIYYKPKNI
ncbi:MAG: winged helix-turn-helix transcriptional regulator [Nanoarchaeota archaeon]|nr:winged helix-turn-helix transcriptional regulator [Nanoarchaeota archaeon]